MIGHAPHGFMLLHQHGGLKAILSGICTFQQHNGESVAEHQRKPPHSPNFAVNDSRIRWRSIFSVANRFFQAVVYDQDIRPREW